MIAAIHKTAFWASLWDNAAVTDHPTQRIVYTPYGDVIVKFCYGSVAAHHESFVYRGRVRNGSGVGSVMVYWTPTAYNSFEPRAWEMTETIIDRETAENVLSILVLKYDPA